MTQFAPIDRRDLFKSSGAVAASAALAAPLTGLMARQAAAAPVDGKGAQTAPEPSPYGDIAPVNDLNTGLPLLQLPRGFSYRSFSWTGDPMNDGQPVPSSHDGMAVVAVGRGRNAQHVLIRNHEIAVGARVEPKLGNGTVNAAAIYDTSTAGGGNTVLKVVNGQLVDHRATIGGTIINCAGGPTLWGTWLTCEEAFPGVEQTPGIGLTKPHGYVFEVSPDPAQTVAEPIRDMGRFSHEAVAIDPRTGEVYLTEDNRNAAGFYRFVPNNISRTYGALGQGGALYAAKVVGVEQANFLALEGPLPSSVATVGQSFEIEWVRIANPDQPLTPHIEGVINNPTPGATFNAYGAYKEARDKGALRQCRGEGIWWSRQEDLTYWTDTNFGYDATNRPGRGLGAVWVYKPNRPDTSRGVMTLVYAAATRIAGNNPDNITVSPRGGVLYMEDGAAVVDQYGPGNRLMGLTSAGQAYIFCKNNVNLTEAQVVAAGKNPRSFDDDNGVFSPDQRGNEFAGGTFTPDGRVLYVNIQTPGITFAIAGPWSRGNL